MRPTTLTDAELLLAKARVQRLEDRITHLANRFARIASKLAELTEELRKANNYNVTVINTNIGNNNILRANLEAVIARVRRLEDLQSDSIYGHPHGDPEP